MLHLKLTQAVRVCAEVRQRNSDSGAGISLAEERRPQLAQDSAASLRSEGSAPSQVQSMLQLGWMNHSSASMASKGGELR
jgi:hypothetical protein